MTIQSLASKIAKIEGKKSQARIYDIREILGILSDMIYENMYIAAHLQNNGMKRHVKNVQKKRAKK